MHTQAPDRAWKARSGASRARRPGWVLASRLARPCQARTWQELDTSPPGWLQAVTAHGPSGRQQGSSGPLQLDGFLRLF
eukprot:NODE_9782_length_461_cov_7.128641_g8687_i0.p3 GENE.NODE_9782_length_461_cov_7.128641_g8687_i0~~NODE_9782_length_461_cov_7.128641_g8687_i0.p3  ORF type:complete len:79 (-),score=6.06 NODE_9782_length_461_cov_7.128641_g8687_i0:26-262(-)